MKYWIFLFSFIFTISAQTEISAEKKKELDHRVEKLVQGMIAKDEAFSQNNKENFQSKDWVKSKLEHMLIIDQDMRTQAKNVWHDKSLSKEERGYIFNVFVREYWSKVDGNNAENLKKILEVYDWITISEFGAAADQQAFVIVQHADHDVQFQKSILKKLEKLYPKNETNPKNYAYLYDRVAAIAEKRPQRYGTQGRVVDGVWEPFPIEDPEEVDKRRASVGLSTLEEYKKLFK